MAYDPCVISRKSIVRMDVSVAPDRRMAHQHMSQQSVLASVPQAHGGDMLQQVAVQRSSNRVVHGSLRAVVPMRRYAPVS
jgi:hypothetical protein